MKYYYSTVLPAAAVVATTTFLPTSTAQQPICIETSAPFDAGFGECSTYAEDLENNAFCDQDVDSNGILAQDACAECGVCVAAPACIDTGVPFDAGFGGCSTYAEGLFNNGFCDQDVDFNGILAQDACAECGIWMQAEAAPTPSPTASLSGFIETETPFNAGFGDCSTYAEGQSNNSFCDQDVDSNGIIAQDACAECGVCVEAESPTTGGENALYIMSNAASGNEGGCDMLLLVSMV